MKTAQAGTLESMDCLVTVTEAQSGAGVKIDITGASAARFRTAMEKKITEVLSAMKVSDIEIQVQDNGALDIVLGARVEAAVKRLGGAA
ncbi:MAG: citrate lyase acyl carrier protein [Synergistaceae bacterium]|nr:citrate lyase acyl carrier protein [Synergistaceae bacterium]